MRRHVRQVLLWHWWMNYHEFKWKSTDWSDAPLIALLRSCEMERRNKLNIYCWLNLRSHECILLTADSVKTHNHILHMQSHYENPPWSKVFISLIFLPCWPTQEYIHQICGSLLLSSFTCNFSKVVLKKSHLLPHYNIVR